jgi:integrase/recombinase XerD
MPKNQRQGKAEIWSDEQFEQLLTTLSPHSRSVVAICYYCCCRVSEARQLRAEDLVNGCIVFRRATTKTKTSREVDIHPRLAELLATADLPTQGYLFPGRDRDKPITRQAIDLALRKACDYLGYQGFSTHSGRRSAATRMGNQGIPLHVIQAVGGWVSLDALQRYLGVTKEQKKEAIAKL